MTEGLIFFLKCFLSKMFKFWIWRKVGMEQEWIFFVSPFWLGLLFVSNKYNADDFSAYIINEWASCAYREAASLSLSLLSRVFVLESGKVLMPYWFLSATLFDRFLVLSLTLLPSKVLSVFLFVFTSWIDHIQPVLANQEHGFMPARSCVTNLTIT